MDVVFSRHATFQMRRRRISKKLVLRAIKFSKNIKLSYRGRKLRRLKVDDKILEVVTRFEDSNIIVVTAYYLKKKL